MEKNRILALLARKMGQVATSAELEELNELLNKYPEYHFIKDTSESMHLQFHPPATHEDALVSRNWDHLAEAMEEPVASVRRPVLIRLMAGLGHIPRAAALVGGIALAAAGYYWLPQHTISTPHAGQLIARNGEKVRQLLPDSSFVWLNAGTQLHYNPDFGKTSREIYLDGEAFFEVAPDRNRPFLVHAGRVTVKVLGTSFNVRAYAKDSVVETTLIKGKVEVQLRNGHGRQILLSPNEKLTVSRATPTTEAMARSATPVKDTYSIQPLVYQNDSTEYNEVAWIDGKLVFWNEPFEEVAEKMQRWYDVRIHFNRDDLKQEILSGTFEHETIDQALKILELTTRFSFTRNGKDIYLQ